MNKIFIFILVLLMSLVGVNATDPDLLGYYPLNNSLLDYSGNGNDLTNSGVTLNSEYISKTLITQYVYDSSFIFANNNISFSGYFYFTTLNNWNPLFCHDSTSNNNMFNIRNIAPKGLATYASTIGATTITTGTWYYLTYTYDDSIGNYSAYKDGNYLGSLSLSDTKSNSIRIGGGCFVSYDTGMVGRIKQVTIYDDILTSDEITTLYSNLGVPDLIATPTIETNLTNGSFFNSENITISLNTTINTNMSFVLDSGTKTSIQNNTNSTTLTLTSLNESLHELILISTDDNGQVNTTRYFTIDLTNPNISKIGNISEDSFSINFSTIYNVTDALSGLASCTINITELENVTVPDNFFINCTDTQTFITAGVHNSLVTATDNAGNIETFSENFTLNPLVFIFFKQLNGSVIFNYTATITHPDNRTTIPILNVDGSINLSPVNNGSLDLGNHSIRFEKLGYLTQTFTVDINQSSGGTTQNFTLSFSSINIQIRDKRTLDIINGTLFNIELIGDIGVETNTTNGYINISNIFFESGEYRLLVSSSDYFAEDVFFNFTNEEVIDVVFYMNSVNESNAGIIVVSVVDGLGQALPGAIVQALQWDGSSSQFIRVSEGQTGLDGRISLNVILEDKIYLFRATNLGNTADSPEYRFLITENGKVITIPLGSTIGERTYLFRNLITTITELSYIGNVSTIEFEWVDQNGISQEVCLNVYRYIGLSETMISENCTTGVSGTYTQAFFINTSHNINIKGEVKIGNSFHTMKTFNYPSENSFPSIISFLGFEFVIIPLLFLLAIAIAIMMENIALGAFLLFLASGFSLYLVPTLINAGIVTFLYAFSMLIIWGANKPR